MNSVFSGIVLCHVLVVCCLMITRCTVESMICGYHEYISKLLLESELNLLKYCNIDILTSILMQDKNKVHFTLLVVPHVTKNEKLAKKSWQIVVIYQICQSFFASKVFYCTVYMYISGKFCNVILQVHENHY